MKTRVKIVNPRGAKNVKRFGPKRSKRFVSKVRGGQRP